MPLVVNYRNYRRQDAYRGACEREHRPLFLILTRRSTAFVEIDLPSPLLFTEAESNIILSLLAEHRTRGRFAVNSAYAYAESIRTDAIPLITQRIARLLVEKERVQR